MVYRPYNNEDINVRPNPHSPAPATVKQTPVDIPGVLDQTRSLYQPYVPPQPNKENT
jgi:hypothetical protein